MEPFASAAVRSLDTVIGREGCGLRTAFRGTVASLPFLPLPSSLRQSNPFVNDPSAQSQTRRLPYRSLDGRYGARERSVQL